MAELATTERWIYAMLAADTALQNLISGRIYSSIAPNLTMPYVVFQFQGGADVRTNGAIRALSSLLYIVRAVDEQNSIVGTLQTMADRIDAVLNRRSGSISGGAVISCVREAPFSLTETAGDRIYRHLGGTYRLQTQ